MSKIPMSLENIFKYNKSFKEIFKKVYLRRQRKIEQLEVQNAHLKDRLDEENTKIDNLWRTIKDLLNNTGIDIDGLIESRLSKCVPCEVDSLKVENLELKHKIEKMEYNQTEEINKYKHEIMGWVGRYKKARVHIDRMETAINNNNKCHIEYGLHTNPTEGHLVNEHQAIKRQTMAGELL